MSRVIAVSVACLLMASAPGATVLLPAEFREIVAGSDVIAHVRVVDVRTGWADGRRRVESVVTADVVSYLKGGAGRTIAFRVPGGQLGRYRTVMVGAPVFSPGEEAVLFLRMRGESGPAVFGLSQGVFHVRQDAVSGRRIVVPPALIASGRETEIVRRGSPARRPLPLDAFGAQVLAVMAEQRGGVR